MTMPVVAMIVALCALAVAAWGVIMARGQGERIEAIEARVATMTTKVQTLPPK